MFSNALLKDLAGVNHNTQCRVLQQQYEMNLQQQLLSQQFQGELPQQPFLGTCKHRQGICLDCLKEVQEEENKIRINLQNTETEKARKKADYEYRCKVFMEHFREKRSGIKKGESDAVK